MSVGKEVRQGARIGELPLVAGHPAIDLVNTVTPRLPVPDEDHLSTPGDLLVWARRAGIAVEAELAAVAGAWEAAPGAAARALSAVKEIRGSLETVLSWRLGLGNTAEVRQTLDFLARQWASAAGRTTLVVGGDNAGTAQLMTGTVPTLLVQDRVAMAVVDLLCHVDLSHLGMCDVEHGGCGWLFIDHSRNKKRKWCTMEDCGAEAKARRLTERRRRSAAAARG